MKYGLIGEKLGHSFSKDIHEMMADYTYELCPLTRDEFGTFMEQKDFRAINVTIPYKEAVIPYIDELDERAAAISAVNTIVNRDGKLFGYNTDFDGFSYLLKAHNISLADKCVLILGAGGTSKTIAAVAKAQGAKEILKSDTEARPGILSYEDAQIINRAEVIINATPNGMYPENSDRPLVDLKEYPNLTAVVDVVYNPIKTNLILAAEELKIPCAGGLEMLVAQAKYAAELFVDQTADDAYIDQIFKRILLQKRNIALVGMPGSGKTTVGKLIAEKLGLPFVDCDEEIEKRAGQSIKEIFDTVGENAFRILETSIIQTLAKEGGRVIATGGGAVLDEKNTHALRQNSVVIFLDKAPEDLAIDTSRPLSPDVEANLKLYAQRYRKYMAAANIKVNNAGTAEAAADAIIKVL